MFTPAAIAGGTALPNGELCSSIRTRSDCCTRLDGSASEYFGERCVPPKDDFFRGSADSSPAYPNSVCEPLGWVTKNDFNNQASCDHTGGMSFPCHVLKV
jgi:hypothetical protein